MALPTGRERRSRERGTVAYALGAVAVIALVVATGCSAGAGPGTAPTTTADTTDDPAHGVHDSPYDVTIQVLAEPANGTPVPVEDVPSLSAANLTDRQRTLLIGLIEDGATDRWQGTSDERAPERIRRLAAVAEKLPPSPLDRDPSEVWRVGRDATGYVVYEGTTYRVEMLKVAP